MNERFPKVCLVMFWVVGVFVTYQLAEFIVALPPAIVSHTRVVPAIRWPHPPGTPAGGQSSPPETPPWKRSYGRMNDCVSPPPVPADIVVAGAAGEAVVYAARHAAAVVPDEVAGARPGANRIDAGVEAVSADRHLPLDRAGRIAREPATLGALSCAPPAADGCGESAKLPLMSPE